MAGVGLSWAQMCASKWENLKEELEIQLEIGQRIKCRFDISTVVFACMPPAHGQSQHCVKAKNLFHLLAEDDLSYEDKL